MIGIISIQIVEYKRISTIVIDIIGKNNYTYLNKIDKDMITSIDSYEKFIYKIEDIDKVNCSLIDTKMITNITQDDLSTKYINESKPLCIKNITDLLGRHIIVTIQKNIFILEIYIN